MPRFGGFILATFSHKNADPVVYCEPTDAFSVGYVFLYEERVSSHTVAGSWVSFARFDSDILELTSLNCQCDLSEGWDGKGYTPLHSRALSGMSRGTSGDPAPLSLGYW